ncbi:MAG: hypothetical protein AAGF79_08875, partial [Pseudomonadota bacterium]
MERQVSSARATGRRDQTAGGWRAALLASAVGLIGLAGATQAAADTAYGCRDLLTSTLVASLEGADGTFYRIRPDLEMHHWIGAQSVDLLARFSD